MMKILKALAVFLSFYIVLLSGIPCVDVVQQDISQKVELSQNASSGHHDTGQCSPFCTCMCCQANFYISITPTISPSESLAIVYYEHTIDFQSLDLFDFLIPPKS